MLKEKRSRKEVKWAAASSQRECLCLLFIPRVHMQTWPFFHDPPEKGLSGNHGHKHIFFYSALRQCQNILYSLQTPFHPVIRQKYQDQHESPRSLIKESEQRHRLYCGDSEQLDRV